MAVPEIAQNKSAIYPNNLLGFLKDLGMEQLKLSIQKSDSRLFNYALELVELEAADTFKALRKVLKCMIQRVLNLEST